MDQIFLILVKRFFIGQLLLCNRKPTEYLTYITSFNPQNTDRGRILPEPKPGKGKCTFIHRKMKLRG